MLAIPTQSKPRLRKQPSENRSYSLWAEVEYKVVFDHTLLRTGRGRSVSISSAVVVFTAEDVLTTGTQIELSIAWPVALNERVSLRLWVSGTIVENQANRVTLEILRHEFRTRLIRDVLRETRTKAPTGVRLSR